MKTQIYLLQATILFQVALSKMEKPAKRNIVFILTDDQDSVLNGFGPMKKTNNLIVDKGMTYINAYATTPLCCPSRTSILTGLYAHTHGTVNNSVNGGCNDLNWQNNLEPKTFARLIQDAGYRTFYAGKYLNQYGKKLTGGVRHIPKGWDWWIGLVGNSVYYNYTLSVNGTAVHRGQKEKDYLTDVLRDYSLEFLNQTQWAKDPFLMVISPPACHDPFTPAKRHQYKFRNQKAPRDPSFNVYPNNTKHWLLRMPPAKLPAKTINKIDQIYRNRWETLLAVDDLVEAVYNKLKVLGLLNNTYIMFSSDNGFHMGQFGLPWDKRQPYETDIKIPLYIRGPNCPKKLIVEPVLTIDFGATILDMAGINTRGFGEGRSFLICGNSKSERKGTRNFLVEHKGEYNIKNSASHKCSNDINVSHCLPEASCKCFDSKNNTYLCLRQIGRKISDIYCEFDDKKGFKEYYNILKDPYELDNEVKEVNLKTHKKVLKCCKKMIKAGQPVKDCLRHSGDNPQS